MRIELSANRFRREHSQNQLVHHLKESVNSSTNVSLKLKKLKRSSIGGVLNRQSLIRHDTKDTKQSEIVALFDKSSSFGEDEDEDLFFRNSRPLERLASQVATIAGENETDDVERSAMATINEIKDTDAL